MFTTTTCCRSRFSLLSSSSTRRWLTTTAASSSSLLTHHHHHGSSSSTSGSTSTITTTASSTNNNNGNNSKKSNSNNASFATTTAKIRTDLPTGVGTRTKIVCTLGPSSDDATVVAQLVDNYMHVARLNFSHAGSDYSYAQHNLDLVRQASGHHAKLTGGPTTTIVVEEGVAEATYTPPPPNVRAVLVDTKGPEIRTGKLPGDVDVMHIGKGATVELHADQVSHLEAPPSTESSSDDPADPNTVLKLHVDYLSLAQTVDIGSEILLDDGLIELKVTDIDTKNCVVTTIASNSGPIKANKGVNLPNATLDLPALTDKDKRDLEWACKVGADYVAASFIRTPDNVRSVVAYLDRCVDALSTSCPSNPMSEEALNNNNNPQRPLRPLVISKIESKEGVDNFHEILQESDGIMVARGDLGVEIPYSKVFAAQKMMVEACNAIGKPVIVATQMLDSMIRNPRPTRAEVTDVGTAVLDGADAVMLSGETAAGKYPVESLKAMASVVWEADQIYQKKSLRDKVLWNQELHDSLGPADQELDSVAAAAVRSACEMNAKFIVLITMSGRMARAVARHRPSIPVLAFCTDPQVARRLQLHRSIYPVMLQTTLDPGSVSTRMRLLRAEAVRTAKELGFTRVGDRIIMIDRTKGKKHDMHDFSHNMKVVTLSER